MLKKLSILLVFICSLIIALLFIVFITYFSPVPSTNRVGVIDMNYILNHSKSYKDYDELVEREHQKAKKIVMVYEEELRALHKRKNSNALFLIKQKEIEALIENLKTQLSTFFKDKDMQLKKKLDKAIKIVAKREKIDLLLHESQVVYKKESCDMTMKVLKEFEG